MFDPELKEIIHHVIKLRGTAITSHMPIIEEVLTIACPDSAVEIQMLIDAGNEQIVADILSPSMAILPRDEMIRQESVRISKALATSTDTARSIVETWEYALNGPGVPVHPLASDQAYSDRALAALREVEQRRFGGGP